MSPNSDSQREKLSGWMKKIVIHKKFEVRKSVWEMSEKISN